MKHYIIATSHRAYDKVTSLLGFKPNEYFCFGKNSNLLEVPGDKVSELLEITGVKMGKWSDGYLKCWSQIAEYDVIEKGA